jgi:hypothetical protein
MPPFARSPGLFQDFIMWVTVTASSAHIGIAACASSSSTAIETKDTAIKNKYIKGPHGVALKADHIVSLDVVQGGALALAAEPSDLEDFGFFLVATTIDEVVYDLARFDIENHAYDAVHDLVDALARKKSGPMIDMFLHDERLRRVSLRDLRLDRELKSRNAALDAAADHLGSRVMAVIDGQKAPLGA